MIKVVIPNYLRKISVAKSRRVKYFNRTGKQLPKKYQNIDLYRWDEKGRLVDRRTGELVIANPKSAGTERFQSIRGGVIYAKMHERLRMKIVDALKAQFKAAIREHKLKKIPYRCKVSLEVHTVYERGNWDLDNMWIYHKAFMDSLVDLKIIKDDNVIHVWSAGQTSFYPIPEDQTRKMVFTIEEAKHTEPFFVGTTIEAKDNVKGGEMEVIDGKIYIGVKKKGKVFYNVANEAIRKAMFHCLNNLMIPSIEMSLYKQFEKCFACFDEYRVRKFIR